MIDEELAFIKECDIRERGRKFLERLEKNIQAQRTLKENLALISQLPKSKQVETEFWRQERDTRRWRIPPGQPNCWGTRR